MINPYLLKDEKATEYLIIDRFGLIVKVSRDKDILKGEIDIKS